jgi:hypothetical protein
MKGGHRYCQGKSIENPPFGNETLASEGFGD